jgi:membrane associated rhomboid family serine protease
MALTPREMLPGEGPSPGQVPPDFEPERGLPPTPVIYALVGVCVLVFAASWARPGMVAAGVLDGASVARGEWWRLGTWILLHANPLHLVMNCWGLWNLGRMLERVLGAGRVVLLTLVGTLGSAAAVLAFSYQSPTLGISGVILAFAGCVLPIVNPSSRRQLGIGMLQVAILSLLPGISWAGHLGGFLAGLAVGLALRGGIKRFDRALPVVALASAGVIAAELLIHR